MNKRLTEEEFQRAIKNITMSAHTRNIAHSVLVKGIPQILVGLELKLTKGTISQTVSRVWKAHKACNIPQGYEKVEAVLPEYQATIVKEWDREARKHIKEMSKQIERHATGQPS